MTDNHVDELLSDLDRAMAVEPSPAVAARVRTRMHAAPSWWRGVPWRTMAASTVVVLLGGYFFWQRAHLDAPSTEQVAIPSLESTRQPASLDRADARSLIVETNPGGMARTAPVSGSPVNRKPAVFISPLSAEHVTMARAFPTVGSALPRPVEAEVLVPPDQVLAWEQLKAGLQDGRIDPTSLPRRLLAREATLNPPPADDAPNLGSTGKFDVIRKIDPQQHYAG